MPIFDLSSRDVLRNSLIPPGWYFVRVDMVGELPSKDGQSTNYPVEGTILANAENGDETYKDYPTPRWSFNSKAGGFVVQFLNALGAAPSKGGRVELKNAEGCVLRVLIEQGEYNGSPQNQINHKYAPKDKPAPSKEKG